MSKLYRGNLAEMLEPYNTAKIIREESIMPLYHKGESGDITITLMNDVKEILSVRTATLEKTFAEGRDYFVKDGRLVIPADSEIRIIPWEEYNPDEGSFVCTLGGKLIFGNANSFHLKQYAVTYIPASNIFEGKYFPTKSENLEKSRRLLTERELRLAFFGDSITYGCNSSGLCEGVPPYLPIYPQMVAQYLRLKNFKIDYYNPSIGGKSSPWGRDTAAYYFDDFRPDLTVIAFGMNDGTGKLPVDSFIGNIKSIIGTIRKNNPNAEFILTATTLPNPISTFTGLQPDYEKPLESLAKEEGCAFLDMTELHRILLTRKEYHHMTGNNINHPTDFLARLYAQGILALLGV